MILRFWLETHIFFLKREHDFGGFGGKLVFTVIEEKLDFTILAKKLDFTAWAQFFVYSEKLDFDVEKLDSIVLAKKHNFVCFSRKYDFFFCFGGKT